MFKASVFNLITTKSVVQKEFKNEIRNFLHVLHVSYWLCQ